jgi:predicted TIM-barrel fold metal-dependent hydrolase
VATLAASYERWFEVLLEFLADLPSPAREAILSGNASRVYGLTD